MNYSEILKASPNKEFKLSKIDANFKGNEISKESVQPAFEANKKELNRLQELLYAEGKHSVLIILQAIDAGGKDGTIEHIFSSINPQGCKVHSFKQPSALEAAHDFLWRCHAAVPAKGEITIFNRSYYEEVLVVRVHELVSKETWAKHYDQINDFERILRDNGTHVLKFYLHISKDEQLRRFKDRLDDPSKQWKISNTDYSDRQKWDDYMEAFEDMVTKCSTEHSPWHVIPANHKWFRDLAVSEILVDYLKKLDMKLPSPSVDIAEITKKYNEELAKQ